MSMSDCQNHPNQNDHMYRISYAYWLDSGGPAAIRMDDSMNRTDAQSSDEAYQNCVKLSECSGRAIYGYTKKYAKVHMERNG